MTTKESIQVGERLLDGYKKMMERMNDAQTIDEVLACLRDIEKEKLNERIVNIEAKLAPLRKQYLVEFEKQSAEANMRIDSVIKEGKKWDGKEPLTITNELMNEITSFELYNMDANGQKDDRVMPQEMRNEIYSKIVGHLNFLKNKVK